MNHNLFLGMYSFKIKKKNTRNTKTIGINNFLSIAYPDKNNKFSDGFVQEIIKLLDTKTFKNERKTHGAILEEQSFNPSQRTFDLLINGGITGLKQYIIDESGEKNELSKDKTIGLKFYARLWLPSSSNSGYIFIQKYGSLSIKPIFDSIIKTVLNNNEFSLIHGRMIPTTTKKRQEQFMKHSQIKDITIVSKKSSYDTAFAQASQATIKLSNIKLSKDGLVDKTDIDSALDSHGFKIADRDYLMKATYQNKTDSYNEEKTVVLDDSEETINIIPSILVPKKCVDIDNSPLFEEMKKLADLEIQQIIKESKL